MRYPFRVLRGSQQFYFSARAAEAKAHLLAECEGLARTPEEQRVQVSYRKVEDLALDRATRPCRMCALSSVLLSVARRSRVPATHLVSFTSQHAPTALDADPLRHDYAKFTESGAARLRRLSLKLGLPVVSTLAGPAAVAAMPLPVAQVFAANLRTALLGPWQGDFNLRAAEVFWTLAVDAPPEVGNGQQGVDELWDLAGRLAS